MTLTFDLVFTIIVSGAHLIHYLRKEFQIWCVDASWNGGVPCTILITVTLTLDLVSRIIVFPILFEVGIPEMMCGCIFVWGYQVAFWIAVTLTVDIISRITVSRACLL